MRRTKIVATIGPKCCEYKEIKNLAISGVNVFRVNFSHGKISDYERDFENIKKARNELKIPISIMVDTRGPELRLKSFSGGKVVLKKGDEFTLFFNDVLGDQSGASVTHPICIKNLDLGTIILANDGQVKFKIIKNSTNGVILKTLIGGELKDNKSLYLKDTPLKLNYLNELDKRDLIWAIQNGCDLIALSFVNEVSDILSVKKLFGDENFPRIIAKIESKRGLTNIDEILNNCDGLMVARGDLGVELAQSKLPKIQQLLIDKARKKAKISIVATEMLESMINSSRPTRAEINDVANAVYQGASAVMLSAETAVGVNPNGAVKCMDDIASQAEKDINYVEDYEKMNFTHNSIVDIINASAVEMSFKLNAKAIVIYTDFGKNAIRISRYQPKCQIIAITSNSATYQFLACASGVLPIKMDKIPADIFTSATEIVKELGIAKTNDKIIVTTGSTDEVNNVLKITVI